MTQENKSQKQHIATKAKYDEVVRFFRTKVPAPDCYDWAHKAMLEFLNIDPARISGDHSDYLMGVSRNFVKKYYTDRARNRRFDATLMSVAEMGTSLSLRMDRHNRVINALQTLEVDEQIAVEAHFIKDKTYESVATILEASRSTAVRRVVSGKEKLLKQLKATEMTESLLAEMKAAYRDA